MSLINSLKTRLGLVAATKSSRGVAKERLSIILAHQRGDVLLEGIDLKALQAEVYECVKVGTLCAADFVLDVSSSHHVKNITLHEAHVSRDYDSVVHMSSETGPKETQQTAALGSETTALNKKFPFKPVKKTLRSELCRRN